MANILIVEDEKIINDLIFMNLKLVGHSCRQVFDGHEATAALEAFRPDLVLLDGNEEIYSDVGDAQVIDEEILAPGDERSKNIAERVVPFENGTRYLFISSRLPDYPSLTFVYARDISRLDDFGKSIRDAFWLINAVVLLLLGVSVYLLLRRVTRPITKLSLVAAEIADGAYGKRVDVMGDDELGRLGESFNRMADSVEENIARRND
jgi:HAMP domain-containing protein